MTEYCYYDMIIDQNVLFYDPFRRLI